MSFSIIYSFISILASNSTKFIPVYFTFSLRILRDVSPRNTPPGDPSGEVVYLRIVLSPEEAFCLQVFLNMTVLQGGVVSTSPNPQAGGPPLVGCPRLLIQFIRSYPPYWRRSSIRNLRTRHAVVTDMKGL